MTGFAPATEPGSWLLLQLRLVANETGKGLRLAWRRRALAVVALLMNALTYLGISLFIGGGHLVEELMVLTLPGLLAVVVAAGVLIIGGPLA